jgi:hypothetical protein
LPVIARIDITAPPRASPSSFLELLVELFCGFHRVLAEHGVADEEDFIRGREPDDIAQLLHERLVDMEPARGVEDYDVVALLFRVF